MKKILTIAGSDCSGGAGIQADLKTMTAHGCYGMSAITALTAQNTTGVYDILDINPKFFATELDCIFKDIFPDAIKIGMVSNVEIIKIIVKKLIKYNAQNIVLDPVMVSTSGNKLISDNAIDTLKKELFPISTIITPNIPEAEILANIKISNQTDMINAGNIISSFLPNTYILIKGGHMINDATDLLYKNSEYTWFKEEKINNPNTHGTGCTLSSAIACNLGYGYDIKTSVEKAKKYLTNALKSMLNLGKGSGPIDHMWNIKKCTN